MGIEKYKRIIIEMIEEHNNPWIKAAFYGDPDVARLVERLYERWEKANHRGIALDYATVEELKFLASKARRYGSMSSAEAMREAFKKRK